MRRSCSAALILFGYLLHRSYGQSNNCFQTMTGAVCCPNVFLCDDNLCLGHQSCATGSGTCTVVQCARAGEPPPFQENPPVVSESPSPAASEVVEEDPTENPQENSAVPQDTAQNENGQPTQTPEPLAQPMEPEPQNTQPPPPPSIDLGPWSDLLTCEGESRRRRREVSALSEAEWQRFLRALNTLKFNSTSRRNPSISAFEDLAVIHTEFVQEAHGGAYFLPWHRLFLYLYESLLREIDPGLTIPYWNWSVERPDNAAQSSIWNRFGHHSATQTEPQCVDEGPWAGWTTNHQTPHCLMRGLTTGPFGTFPPLEPYFNIMNLISSDLDFYSFATTVEAIHGSAHVGVGGDMAILGTAPNDPIFFMHHAFVDYIWYRWQRNGGGSPGRYGGTHPTLNGGEVSRDDRMAEFMKTVGDAQGLNCVRYIDSESMLNYVGPWGVQGRTSNVRGSPAPKPSHEILFSPEENKTSQSFAVVSEDQAAIADAVLKSLDED